MSISTSFHGTTNPLPFVEQLTITELLGIYISATFSAVANYLHSLRVKAYALHIIFTAIVLSVVTFALPSFVEQYVPKSFSCLL